jgi:hypothetical protein
VSRPTPRLDTKNPSSCRGGVFDDRSAYRFERLAGVVGRRPRAAHARATRLGLGSRLIGGPVHRILARYRNGRRQNRRVEAYGVVASRFGAGIGCGRSLGVVFRTARTTFLAAFAASAGRAPLAHEGIFLGLVDLRRGCRLGRILRGLVTWRCTLDALVLTRGPAVPAIAIAVVLIAAVLVAAVLVAVVLFAGALITTTLIAIALIAIALITIALLAPVWLAAFALALRLLVGLVFGLAVFAVFTAVLALAIGIILPTVVAKRGLTLALALLVLALPLIGQHAKIVIGELKVIFLLDAIAVQVRIMRQLAILLQQLRRIAPRAAVDAVDLLATAALLTIAAAIAVVATPAAPAVIISTIIVQG